MQVPIWHYAVPFFGLLMAISTASAAIVCDVTAPSLTQAGNSVQTSAFPYVLAAAPTSNMTVFTLSGGAQTSFTGLTMYTLDPTGKRVGQWGLETGAGQYFIRDTTCSGSNKGQTLTTNSTVQKSLPIRFGWIGGMEGNYTLQIAVWKDATTVWTTSTTFQATMASGGATGDSGSSGMSDKTKYIIIGCVVGGVVLIIILIVIICVARRNKKRKAAREAEEAAARQYGNNYTMYTEAQDDGGSYYYNDGQTSQHQSYYRQSAAPSQTTAWRSETGEERSGFV